MAEKKSEKTKIAGKLEKLIGEIEKLTMIETADLVKALEDKFGVTAVAPAAATSAGPSTEASADQKSQAAPSVQTTFNVVLTSAGANKISVIKMVREINQSLGLKEAKDLVESAPKEVLTGANKETSQEAKKKLEGAGATVELK